MNDIESQARTLFPNASDAFIGRWVTARQHADKVGPKPIYPPVPEQHAAAPRTLREAGYA